MPKRRYDRNREDDYGEVYGDVYGKTKRVGRDRDAEIYGETTNTYGNTGSSGQASSILKYFVIGFSVVTIAGFSGAFVLIMQLRQEVTQLQNSETSQQQVPDATTPSSVTQPPPFTVTLGPSQGLPEVTDPRVAAALRQLNDADNYIREAFEKISEDYRSLQEWTEQAITKSTDQINYDLCGLEVALEQWALPSDSVGALLSLEGWTKAHDGLYIQKFFDRSKGHYKSYADAKLECEKLEARLASKSLPHLAVEGVNFAEVWAAYDDIQSEGLWTWSDGTTAFDPERFQWVAGQPDNARGDEDCAYITRYANGKYILNDISCQTRALFICEKDTTSIPSVDICN